MGAKIEKAKTIAVSTARENAGTVNNMVDSLIDHWVDGDDLSTAWDKVEAELVQEVSERYSARIAAALRRAGLSVADDDVLTPARIRELISEQSGIDLDELSTEGVARGIDRLASARLSEALGVEITTMATAEGLKQSLMAALVASIENGTAERLIAKVRAIRLRKVAQWRREGVDAAADQRRLENRARQQKYARTHSQIWVEK